jgi:hypothetical protein
MALIFCVLLLIPSSTAHCLKEALVLMELTLKEYFYREYSTESGQNETQLNTMNAQDVTNVL